MPAAASTRLGLIGPAGTDGIPLGDNQIRAIIAQLESVAVAFLTPSAYADRPAAAAGNAHKVHIATDTGVIGISTGSTWVDINPKDAAAGTASLRTLGTGATQAAAGNHAHSGVYDPAGTAAAAAAAAQAAAIAASQPLDSDLTALAANGAPGVTGLALLLAATATAARNVLGAAALHTVTSPADITGHTTYDSDVAIAGISAVTVTPPDTSSKYRYKIEHQGLLTNVGAYTLRLGFLKDGSVFKYKQWVAYSSRMGDNFEYVHSPGSTTAFTIQPFWRHQTGTGATDLIGPQFTIEKIA